MDETTIAEMRARAAAAKERIDAVEEGDVDEPEFDEVVTAAAMFANDAAALAEDVAALTGEVERLTRERDAYRKAKAENDERFMLERDEARRERDDLFMTVNALNRNAEESLTKLDALAQERDTLSAKLASLEPLIEALLCADRQELPRDLADRVTAYIKALPCQAVTS